MNFCPFLNVPRTNHLVSILQLIAAFVLVSLSLEEYCIARKEYCLLRHVRTKCNCQYMITAAEKILHEGISSLSSVYRTAFSHLVYQPQAKRRLLQMPVAALRLGEPSSGYAEVS